MTQKSNQTKHQYPQNSKKGLIIENFWQLQNLNSEEINCKFVSHFDSQLNLNLNSNNFSVCILLEMG